MFKVESFSIGSLPAVSALFVVRAFRLAHRTRKNMALPVKVYLHRPLGGRPTVHRAQLAEPYSFETLVEAIRAFAEGSAIGTLLWRDSEKDLITLRGDEDLRLAAEHVLSEGLGLLRVHADLKYDEAEPAGEALARAQDEPVLKTAKREEKRYPAHKLPGGGQYSGYVRTTGPDGKIVERELTLNEAQQLLQEPPLLSRSDDFGADWFSPSYRRPRVSYYHPHSLPFYF